MSHVQPCVLRQASHSPAFEAAMAHYKDCIRTCLRKWHGYECQVRHPMICSHALAVRWAHIHIFALALSHVTDKCVHVYSSDPGRAVHMPLITDGCVLLQEGEGDFMLAFPSSVKAVMFCLKVRPANGHGFLVLSRSECRICKSCMLPFSQWRNVPSAC